MILFQHTGNKGSHNSKLLLINRPVVFTRDILETQGFRDICDKQNLLNQYGEYEIILSSANSFSYDKTRVSLRHYVENIMSQTQTLELSGANTFYHFGDNDHVLFKQLFDQYNIPFALTGTPSWGLAAGSTGVPFHTHGAVFAEVIYGKKVCRFFNFDSYFF
jgi:hypothetical protein